MNKVTEQIHARMMAEIKKHGLKIMSESPEDLEMDSSLLASYECCGSQVAWAVGDTDSQLLRLGLHSSENQLVGYITNMPWVKRFYLFEYGHDSYECQELTKLQFAGLANTHISYNARNEHAGGFSLYKDDVLVANCTLEITGDMLNQVKKGRYKLASPSSPAIYSLAAEVWLARKLYEMTGTISGEFDIQPE